MYHRGCWHIVGRCFFYRYRHNRSCRKRFTTQKAFVPHAALLRQAFAHCARFPTAASRRSLDRVSVPVWLIVLSDQLSVVALVGRYPANKLMDREPLLKRKTFFPLSCDKGEVFGISTGFPVLSQSSGQVAHVLLTRSPLTCGASPTSPFDLHVLSTPPAFILSQNQTLHQDLSRTEVRYESESQTSDSNTRLTTKRTRGVLLAYCILLLTNDTTS